MELLPDLRAFARFLARDRGQSDDLVQETVVRALGALEQFDPETSLKAWLFTILRNLFYEQARRNRRERELVGEYCAEARAEVSSAEGAARVQDLERVLMQLKPLLREALILVGAQELSYEEAAKICDVPAGTMKARVSRARAAMAEIYAKETEDTKNI